jgi:hypothetical protein
MDGKIWQEIIRKSIVTADRPASAGIINDNTHSHLRTDVGEKLFPNTNDVVAKS